MSKTERPPYQFHLGEEIPRTIYYFDQGTVIYPLYYRRGSLRNGLYAEPTGIEVNGLTGFRSLGRIDLYFDGQYWS